jgi:hypothetical protein
VDEPPDPLRVRRQHPHDAEERDATSPPTAAETSIGVSRCGFQVEVSANPQT